MDFLSWFDINNTLVNFSIGGGYAMSWIEAIGTIFGLLCIWFASKEKTINFFFGLINVTLFCIIFFQIQLYGLLLLQVFFFCANIYGWFAWTKSNTNGDSLEIRWLSKPKLAMTVALSAIAISLLTLYINPVFFALANFAVDVLNIFGANLADPTLQPGAFPFWDATMTVLSIVAQILMTRKYVENWILWVVINIISVGLYAAQGVYALSIQYAILLFVAANGARCWIAIANRNKPQVRKAIA
ncbi:nicotinamide riboside transporter PnuC [Photobacterium kishitanii]|uniref:Nicotinamide riboside transporter PnuC n=1 Tax=Photobacterium kishitanii TaxID=318456 RepID=A0AAX0YY62_9GAMM|nr:nicotinamide riboside transporter PnuC [Photobacterium kishitanii]KJG09697.1 nicotinamide mononucleotide transporter [Photobacterium kishitanii]KJG57956.1 nicotinamide mononucleotide transporter [Photobacterium kishitanii]KJG61529.1 nicotinamide mononucleotide transporter [Photobacterium kishitanii]KJG66338.1 nicotinamide mononucleotide transporter [Photobacterium kishitanii]KJG69579.1 nicotinamide mononucleotide transporter [Photobacterium kishitanii]